MKPRREDNTTSEKCGNRVGETGTQKWNPAKAPIVNGEKWAQELFNEEELGRKEEVGHERMDR